MKAVYLRTVLDKLAELSLKADREGRKIDYVIITPKEYEELRGDVRSASVLHYRYGSPYYWKDPSPATCHIRTVDLEDKTVTWRNPGERFHRFRIEDFTVLGMNVVIAPERFH